MITEKDPLKDRQPERSFVARGYRSLKSAIIDPPWIKAIRKHIEDNYESAAVFAENDTTKYIIDALERDAAANLKLLKTEKIETSIRVLQGVINGIETALVYIKRIQNEVKNV